MGVSPLSTKRRGRGRESSVTVQVFVRSFSRYGAPSHIWNSGLRSFKRKEICGWPKLVLHAARFWETCPAIPLRHSLLQKLLLKPGCYTVQWMMATYNDYRAILDAGDWIPVVSWILRDGIARRVKFQAIVKSNEILDEKRRKLSVCAFLWRKNEEFDNMPPHAHDLTIAIDLFIWWSRLRRVSLFRVCYICILLVAFFQAVS